MLRTNGAASDDRRAYPSVGFLNNLQNRATVTLPPCGVACPFTPPNSPLCGVAFCITPHVTVHRRPTPTAPCAASYLSPAAPQRCHAQPPPAPSGVTSPHVSVQLRSTTSCTFLLYSRLHSLYSRAAALQGRSLKFKAKLRSRSSYYSFKHWNQAPSTRVSTGTSLPRCWRASWGWGRTAGSGSRARQILLATSSNAFKASFLELLA